MGPLSLLPVLPGGSAGRALAVAGACLCLASAGPAPPADDAETLFEMARAAKLEGSVLTVSGPAKPATLGVTLMHEHLFIDWFARFPWPAGTGPTPDAARQMQESGWPLPADARERRLYGKRDLDLGDIDLLRQGARSRSNYTIDDESLVAGEVGKFQVLGGRTVVDQTPEGLGRDPERLRRFSRATGLNVVMGAGWYRWPFHPAEVKTASVEALTARLVRDVVVGSGSRRIRAGIIGEIPLDSRSIRIAPGASNAEVQARSQAARARLLATPVADRDAIPLAEIYDPQELKVLRAAARASRITGAALSLHAVDPWTGYLAVVEAEGVDPARTILGHAHYVFRDPALLRATLEKGVVLEADYDLQHYPTRAPVGEFNAILDGLVWAVRNGYRDQLLLSQDICNKIGLQRYGGGGYVTLHTYVFPYLKARGVTDDDLEQIMVRNPARLLTLAAPRPVRR